MSASDFKTFKLLPRADETEQNCNGKNRGDSSNGMLAEIGS